MPKAKVSIIEQPIPISIDFLVQDDGVFITEDDGTQIIVSNN